MKGLLVLLLTIQSLNILSQNQGFVDQVNNDSTESLLNNYTDRQYIFIGESHWAYSNALFQSEIIAYYVKNGFNAIILERGYAEVYLLNKALKDKDKDLVKRIWNIDFLLNKELILYMIDSFKNDPPVIIGIDYEQDIRFTKWIINDVLFSCHLVQNANATPRDSLLRNLIYLDYDPPLTFLNDTIKNFYDIVNCDDISLQNFELLYRDIAISEMKYRDWFGESFELIERCVNSVCMTAYEDCYGINDTNSCNKREVWMFENFYKYVLNDSLKAIGVFGFNHILKYDAYADRSGQNYKSIVAMLIRQGKSVASFFPVYSVRKFQNYICKNHDRYHIDDDQYDFLLSRRGKLPFLLYVQPNYNGWEESRKLFDLIIISSK